MAHNKIDVKESEKSSKVLMNNWSLDVILGKETDRIGRSEKTVVNRFTMEQKMLHKRYKKMLHHSKLSFARITSNREMEKDLRSKSTFKFNTNVGEDDENDMLKRVWDYGTRCRSKKHACRCERETELKRAHTTHGEETHRKHSSRKPRNPPSTEISGDGPTNVYLTAAHSPDSGLSSGLSPFASSETWTERPSTSVSLVHPSVDKRPITAIITKMSSKSVRQVDMDSTLSPRNSSRSVLLPGHKGGEIKRVASANARTSPFTKKPRAGKPAPKVIEAEKDPTDNLIESDNDVDDSELTQEKIPSPSGQFLETMNQYLSPSRTQTQMTPLQSSSRKTSRNESRTFRDFVGAVVSREPGGRPNLLDIQKVKVRIADYDGQVDKFTERVAFLKAPASAITDYYTSRLMEGTQKGKKYTPMIRMTDPPEHELRKELGDTRVKSLTLKLVDTDFRKRPSTFIDVSAY